MSIIKKRTHCIINKRTDEVVEYIGCNEYHCDLSRKCEELNKSNNCEDYIIKEVDLRMLHIEMWTRFSRSSCELSSGNEKERIFKDICERHGMDEYIDYQNCCFACIQATVNKVSEQDVLCKTCPLINNCQQNILKCLEYYRTDKFPQICMDIAAMWPEKDKAYRLKLTDNNTNYFEEIINNM